MRSFTSSLALLAIGTGAYAQAPPVVPSAASSAAPPVASASPPVAASPPAVLPPVKPPPVVPAAPLPDVTPAVLPPVGPPPVVPPVPAPIPASIPAPVPAPIPSAAPAPAAPAPAAPASAPAGAPKGPPPTVPQVGLPPNTPPPFNPASVAIGPDGLPDLSASAAKYPKGPDSDTAKILNQAPAGRYQVRLATDAHFPNRTLYLPQKVGRRTPMPLLAWENGSCNLYGRMYQEFLVEIASHGYFVVAPGVPNALTGRSTADWQTTSIALAQNWSRAPFEIDEKVAVAGHSCGGGETMRNLAADRDGAIATGVILNAAGMSSAATFATVDVPMLWVHGGKNDTEAAMDANLAWVRQNKPKLPVVEVGLQTGHLGSFWSARGGIYAETVVKWLDWQIKEDWRAEEWFMGGANSSAAKRGWTVNANAID